MLTYTKDTWQFIYEIKSIHILNNYTLISLDIESQYTNLQTSEVKKIINKNFHEIKKHTNIPKKDFLEAVNLCLDWSYCIFNEKFYKQIKGVPMGSPIPPTAANLVMEFLMRKF